MIELETQPAVLRMTIEVKRAATGATETYELIGTPIQPQEQDDVSHTSHSLS
jgi:hypothetical protein